MRNLRSFTSLSRLTLFSLIAICSVCFAQSNKEESTPQINIESLLTETGYKYVQVRQNLWRITEVPYKTKNLKTLYIFVRPNSDNKSLKVSLVIGILTDLAETTEFKDKLNDVRERFKPTEFQLSKVSITALTDIPAGELNKDGVIKRVEKLVDEGDQACGELMKYIRLEPEPSLGQGTGGGIGAGQGGGIGRGPGAQGPVGPPSIPIPPVNSPPDTPVNPPGNIARTVDSRPVLLNRVKPSYTEQARQNGVQGVVRLRLLVDETGTVRRVVVIKGLPDGLNEKAVEAGYKMKFKPAMKDGKPVTFWIIADAEFNLR